MEFAKTLDSPDDTQQAETRGRIDVRAKAKRGGPSAKEPVRQSESPRVWLILSDKKGDNTQAIRVAEALGWRFEHKHVQMKDAFVLGKPRVQPSLDHIDLSRSDPLEAPWPDLIITVGRRPSAVALKVREQSGGSSKIVLIGKTSGPLDRFDLVVASGESSFPPLPNIVDIALPLMSLDAEATAAEAKIWAPKFAGLSRPLIAMLIGGATGHFVFDSGAVDRLVKVVEDAMAETCGTVYVTTSRRTPKQTVEALEKRLPPGARLFAWTPDAADNPYKGLLALADGFIVTGDSISMMVEVVLAKKPLVICPVPVSLIGWIDGWRRAFIRNLYSKSHNSLINRLRRPAASLIYRLHLANPTRDFAGFHQLLIDRGWAVPLGQGFPEPRGDIPDDLSKVVASIRTLCNSS